MTEEAREGGCSCGKVRYKVFGGPQRVGLCHCTDCRKESGSLFTAFAIWPINRFETSGETRHWKGRRFCPACGSRLFSQNEDAAEIKLGTLDPAPNELRPSYELWIKRREPWLHAVEDAAQFVEDRT